MSVIGAPRGLAASLATPRNAAIGSVLLLAIALAVVSLSNDDLRREVGNGVTQGVNSIKSVAAILNERSPGERAQGALASLKHKRIAAVHQRALAKVRGPGPLASLLETPVTPPITPPRAAAPLYNLVAGGPPVVLPDAIVPGGPPAAPGGPPIFSPIPPPGGGGGIITPPPVVTSTPIIPEVPVIPAVPEPSSWAMMLVGFVVMARTLRRNWVTAPETPAN